MTPEQEEQLSEVVAFMQALKTSTTIPFEVDAALRERFGLSGIPITSLSAKSANSEDVTVDEAGAASYAVMNDPVGFLQLTLGNTTYYVPYFNA